MVTRRLILKWMSTGLVALAACTRGGSRTATAAGKTMSRTRRTLTILHTNDLHGHLTEWRGFSEGLQGKIVGGVACLATAVKRIRSESQAVLLLDAGDLIGDTMLADLTQGEAVIGAYNAIGYDAMTFGNHEPDFGVDVLRQRMAQASFPFLAANLRDTVTGQPFASPWIIKEIGGTAVGILGLTYPKTPWTTAAKNVSGLQFEAPETAVREELPKLRKAGAQVVIVLSHLGLTGDKALAEAVEGIDVIVGGHSHNRMTEAASVGKTLIVQAGAHGSDLGRLELEIDDGKVVSHRQILLPLDHEEFPPDAKLQQFVQEQVARHAAALDEQIGVAADWLIRAQTLAGKDAEKRSQESAVDSLFADIVRSALRADIGFLPGVGYGVGIPPGAITAAQLRQLVPHDGKLIAMSLTGAQVRTVLEQAVENVYTPEVKRKVGGMIQVAGLQFRYDSHRAAGDRVTRVKVGEQALNDDAEYRVATNSMLANGGHNQRVLLEGSNRQEKESQYETIREWFKQNSPVHAPERGRIMDESSV